MVIAAVAAVNVNINNETENALSALSLANVEALAQGESGNNSIACYSGTTSSNGNYFGLECGSGNCGAWKFFSSVSSTSRCTPR